MVKLTKDKFIKRFLDDQHKYRMNSGFYLTWRSPKGKVMFNDAQIMCMRLLFERGETMTSIGKKFGCSRQTISENLTRAGAK